MKYLRTLTVTCLAWVSGIQAGELSGLWTGKGRFGPDAGGPLVIEKQGGGYIADMMGRRIAVRTDAGELRFELPDRQGSFRGKLEGKELVGYWLRPSTPVNWGGAEWPVALSPVRLAPDGANRWRGSVTPIRDDFTFHLLSGEAGPDGSMRAVLRNPEFDFGTQQGVDRLLREGDRVRLMGKRRGQEREIGAGNYDAENQVFTLNFASRGGSYDFRRASDDSEYYPRGRNPGRYSYVPPLPFDDGWPTSTLDAENIDRPAIQRFVQKLLDMPMDSADAPQIHGVLMARHGKLVLEEYFHGEFRDKPHMTRSASKSVTAVLAGAVMQAGGPLKLTDAVYQVMHGGRFPAGLDPQKRTMTLEHLLTMSSGLFCDDGNDDAPGNEETIWEQDGEPDFYKYTLKVPQATAPGEKAVYCSCSPNLALGMIGRATGEFPIYSFDRLVARPMKFGNYSWMLDKAGNPYGGGGTMFLPRDFMKFGQLMLNGGTWEGRRILGREFVAQASARHYHLANIYYGYNWWNEDFPYKDRVVQAYSALGAGGQAVVVVPELDLVIAIFGGNYISRVQLEFSHNWVPRYFLPAVREVGDDRDAPVMEREFKSPYGRSADGSRVSPTQ